MANSFVRYTGNGSTSSYAVPFSYRAQGEVAVTIDGVATTAFTWDGAGTNITFTSPPANLSSIEIRRTTSQAARLVDYADGSVLKENDLDTDSEQGFFMSQEAIDDANDRIKLDNADFQWDAQSKRIKNVADPTANTDAVNKQYISTNIPNINTVAGIASDVTTVAGIASDVTAVAGDATDIGTVAGKATEIGRLGTAEAVADMAILGTADVVADMNTLATSDIVSDLNTLATSDIVSDLNTLATSANVTNMATLGASGVVGNIATVAGISSNVTSVAGIASDVTTVAGDATEIGTVAGIASNITTVAGVSANVTTVAGISANVTSVAGIASDVSTVASNISNVSNFANRYRISTNDPSTSLDEGDLAYVTSANALKYYNGSSWNTITTDTDVKTNVSANDTTAGYLNGKLVAGEAVTFTENSDGGDETLTIAATDPTPLAIALG